MEILDKVKYFKNCLKKKKIKKNVYMESIEPIVSFRIKKNKK